MLPAGSLTCVPTNTHSRLVIQFACSASSTHLPFGWVSHPPADGLGACPQRHGRVFHVMPPEHTCITQCLSTALQVGLTPDGRLYLAMEYADSGNMRQWLDARGGKLEVGAGVWSQQQYRLSPLRLEALGPGYCGPAASTASCAPRASRTLARRTSPTADEALVHPLSPSHCPIRSPWRGGSCSSWCTALTTATRTACSTGTCDSVGDVSGCPICNPDTGQQ